MDFTNAGPFTPFCPKEPPVVACHDTYTVPFGPTAMFGPWFPQIPLLIFSGVLKDTPWSVDRANWISLHPNPWKVDQAV